MRVRGAGVLKRAFFSVGDYIIVGYRGFWVIGEDYGVGGI